MNIRQCIFAISILVAFFSIAYAEGEQPYAAYEMIGIIDTLNLHKDEITISSQTFSISPFVEVHTVVKNTIASLFLLEINMPVGINFEEGTNKIIEIWVLGKDPSDLGVGFNYGEDTSRIKAMWNLDNNISDPV